MVKFIVSVKSPDNHGRLRQTGVVWEHCDAAAHLARDAASAAAIVADRQTALVRDVIEELQSTAEASDDEKQSAVIVAVIGKYPFIFFLSIIAFTKRPLIQSRLIE